ncbi:MAG TPA: AbgT family transporter [Victivallales bacterium]|nr:AbgT family transporter [Victivallales bacterium]
MPRKKKIIERFLNSVEVVGNKLPHPATLFFLFAVAVLILSYIASILDWSAINPVTKEIINPVDLLSTYGVHEILNKMVTNFTGFAPLGVVIVAMLGIGLADSSGLIEAVLRLFVLKTPRRLLTFVLVFAGVISNLAADVGYVLLIPLAGIIFISIKRHPIVGMAAAFAGVSGGYSANLFIGTLDPLLGGLSTEAARILDPAYTVLATANYYFMVVSTFLVAILGTFVTEKIIAPRFENKEYKLDHEVKVEHLSSAEKKGLVWTLIAFIILVLIVVAGIIPTNGPLRGIDGNLLSSPLIKDSIAFIFIFFCVLGFVYGYKTGKFKTDSDVVQGITDNIKTLATYIVLVFFAAQFIAYFKWSNLGQILAIKGADLLVAMNVGTVPLIVGFIILAAIINLVMGSASAKWALIAPIFIPMFMQLQFSPELTQVLYRIGDSCTNLISPMMSYFALIIAYFQKYDEDANIGTIISTMLPYSIMFLIGWSILAIIWVMFGLPLGPGAPLFYK